MPRDRYCNYLPPLGGVFDVIVFWVQLISLLYPQSSLGDGVLVSLLSQ